VIAALAASVSAIPGVVTRTHVGQILAARLVALGVALRLSFEGARAFRAFVLLVALAIALSLRRHGHESRRAGEGTTEPRAVSHTARCRQA
jgi:hypothetical protein